MAPPAGGFVIAADGKAHHNEREQTERVEKLIELCTGFVVAPAGLWKTDDGTIDIVSEIRGAYRVGDGAASFLARFHMRYLPKLTAYLQKFWQENPDGFRSQYLSRINPPTALLVCNAEKRKQRADRFEYHVSIEDNKPMIRLEQLTKGDKERGYYLGIGDGGVFVDVSDPQCSALVRRNDFEGATRLMVQQAIAKSPATCAPPVQVKIIPPAN